MKTVNLSQAWLVRFHRWSGENVDLIQDRKINLVRLSLSLEQDKTRRPPEAKVLVSPCGMFSCPEDSCIKTFQRSSTLQAHLDEGRHKYALEKETLLDKAKRGYAAKITGERIQVPTSSLTWCSGPTSDGMGTENSQEENHVFTGTKEIPY